MECLMLRTVARPSPTASALSGDQMAAGLGARSEAEAVGGERLMAAYLSPEEAARERSWAAGFSTEIPASLDLRSKLLPPPLANSSAVNLL
jgi:hypothetical protein